MKPRFPAPLTDPPPGDQPGLARTSPVAGPRLPFLSPSAAGISLIPNGGSGTQYFVGSFDEPRADSPATSQAQAAWQFLRAVLRADYRGAYGRLAPEVRRQVSLTHFQALARPLWKSGQPRSQEIELYKLGVRLGERGSAQLFYSFSFAADSAMKTPPVLLETTFRDTTSRMVLGFGLRYPKTPIKPSGKPAQRK